MTTQPETDAPPSSTYPVAYFLCDGVTDAKTLKGRNRIERLTTALALARTPKLRKARIVGYRRSLQSGDGSSTLAFDAYSFGEWSGEEVVKGVVFEALNLEEERRLMQYVGGTGETKQVEIEVACPSFLGKVGKTMRMLGRIFVPEGDGDTLVGSMRSFMRGEGRSEAEGMGLERDHDNGFSETRSMAVVDGHPTPRISPSISTLNDADVPHQSLDEPPSAAIHGRLTPQQYEHPIDPEIETMDWAATSEIETIDTKDIKDTKVFKKLMGIEEPKKVKVVEVQETAETAETDEPEEIKEIDDIDNFRDTQVETEYQRFLLAVHRGERAVPIQALTSNTITKVDEEGSAPALERQPWSPTTAWRKEHATAPVRPVLTASATSQFSGTPTRIRKTSDSIKSLVDKFENLTPQNTPSKGA